MSHCLALWKGPVTVDSDEAARLLRAFDERGDDSAFEPSAELARVGTELLRRFPNAPDGPWGEYTPKPVDRLLALDLRSSAGDDVIDAIVKLAFEHQLVLYDPQGPDVGIPADPAMEVPTPKPRLIDYLKLAAMGLAAGGVFWIGWRIEVPVIDWVLMIVGGFILSVVLFLAWAFVFPPADEDARRSRRRETR